MSDRETGRRSSVVSQLYRQSQRGGFGVPKTAVGGGPSPAADLSRRIFIFSLENYNVFVLSLNNLVNF